jgi:hypothetical protein
VAAKRKQKSPLKPWIAVALGLAIAGLAAIALVSDQRLSLRSPARSQDGAALEAAEDHDRDQIDQASRDQLREILRAAGNGD